MFSNHSSWQDASRPQQSQQQQQQQISPDDFQTLVSLATKYGPVNLMFFLKSLGEPSRMSTMSQMTLSSNASSIPSLTWSTSEPCHSETASIMSQATQATWSDQTEMGYVTTDVPAIAEPSWAGSPATPHPSREKSESSMALALAAAANANNSQAGRKAIECTMCFVEGIVVGFSRKSDFKKHLQNFHHTNTIWMCQYAGCSMTFDFEKAYVAHVKATHTDMHLPPSRARVEMCPQLVYACGFRGCKDRVFEARTEEEAASLRDKYFDHVAKHFDMGFCVAEWEYYTQIHNLLRQEAVKDVWKQCVWQKSIRNSLRWQPRAAADLKRLLECRHLGDLPRLLQWAWTLGGEPYSNINCDPPELPAGYSLPLKKDCPLSASNHDVLINPARAQQHYQQEAHRQAQEQARQLQQQQQQSFQFSLAQQQKAGGPGQGIFMSEPQRTPSMKSLPPPPPGASQAQHELGRPTYGEAEWNHQHPAAQVTIPDQTPPRWQTDEDYKFAAQTAPTGHLPATTAGPGPGPASEPVDHPMAGVAAEMHHPAMHPQAGPTLSHPSHPPPPAPIQAMGPAQRQHPSQNQQWQPDAMEVMTMDTTEDPYEDGTRPKTPKRPLSVVKRSVESFRKRRTAAGTEAEQMPAVTTMMAPGYEMPMRNAHMAPPGPFYHDESIGVGV